MSSTSRISSVVLIMGLFSLLEPVVLSENLSGSLLPSGREWEMEADICERTAGEINVFKVLSTRLLVIFSLLPVRPPHL